MIVCCGLRDCYNDRMRCTEMEFPKNMSTKRYCILIQFSMCWGSKDMPKLITIDYLKTNFSSAHKLKILGYHLWSEGFCRMIPWNAQLSKNLFISIIQQMIPQTTSFWSELCIMAVDMLPRVNAMNLWVFLRFWFLSAIHCNLWLCSELWISRCRII